MRTASGMELLESERAAPACSTPTVFPLSKPITASLGALPAAQESWSELALSTRLGVLRRARHLLATQTDLLTNAISSHLARTPADTLVAEVLPLLAACRFLEQRAPSILQPRALGASGRPSWLPGLSSTIERVPLGSVLVIGPSNYPLFLPGVQVLQALAVGNSVIWKPGQGGRAVALVVAKALTQAGLPDNLLVITAEDTAAAEAAIDRGVNKIILTGSAATGRAVLHRAATHLTPVIAELSGADALIVLPGADLNAVSDAVAFSLRLNGSATCMATRRLLLVDASPTDRDALFAALRGKLADLPAVALSSSTAAYLHALLHAACAQGASIAIGGWSEDGQSLSPTIVVNAKPEMELPQTDLFVPILSVLDVHGEAGVLAAQRACPLALTAAIFGDAKEAQRLARKLKVGVVLINDVIVATADPRLPFGGRGQSGFGSTRGAEGLLEMTAPRVIATQRGSGRRRFEPTGALHRGLFAGLAALLYAGSWQDRWQGLIVTTAAGRALSASRRQIRQAKKKQVQIQHVQIQQVQKSSGVESSCM